MAKDTLICFFFFFAAGVRFLAEWCVRSGNDGIEITEQFDQIRQEGWMAGFGDRVYVAVLAKVYYCREKTP